MRVQNCVPVRQILWGVEQLHKRFFRLFRIEFIRSRTAFVVDLSFVKDVDPLRPSGENFRSRVVHTIYKSGDGQIELFGTEPGSGQSLLNCFMLLYTNTGLFVGLGLPLVYTVGFSYVNDEKMGRI